MKKYKNFLFVPYSGHKGTYGDVSDGYLNEACGGNRKNKTTAQKLHFIRNNRRAY